MATKKIEIKWFKKAEEQDYLAAVSYLSLIFDESKAKSLVKKLRRAPISKFKAKDIFRASGLSLLGISNSHLIKDQHKIRNGEELSPLLLIRNPLRGQVIIADGYHRLCAVYTFDEDAVIPCRIA